MKINVNRKDEEGPKFVSNLFHIPLAPLYKRVHILKLDIRCWNNKRKKI